MKTSITVMALALGVAALGGCNRQGSGNAASGNSAAAPKTNVPGKSTLADGLTGATKFAAAIKAAGLDRTLAGQGPYTVLVPSDDAFAKLPPSTLDGLMQPGSRAQLTSLLTLHILPGVILGSDIDRAIQNGKGSTKLATMNGGTLTATKEGGAIVIADDKGDKARLDGVDDEHSNGVIHHLDTVLMPSAAAKGPQRTK